MQLLQIKEDIHIILIRTIFKELISHEPSIVISFFVTRYQNLKFPFKSNYFKLEKTTIKE